MGTRGQVQALSARPGRPGPGASTRRAGAGARVAGGVVVTAGLSGAGTGRRRRIGLHSEVGAIEPGSRGDKEMEPGSRVG